MVNSTSEYDIILNIIQSEIGMLRVEIRWGVEFEKLLRKRK